MCIYFQYRMWVLKWHLNWSVYLFLAVDVICVVVLCCICAMKSTPIITFREVQKWQCTLGRPLPRERKALGVFASIILFLTRRPHSAVVVRFANGRRIRGAGRGKYIYINIYSLLLVPTPTTGFQTALFHARDVWAFLCRQHLGKRNAATAQPRCHPEYRWRLPPCTFLEVGTYIDGFIPRRCVFQRGVLFFARGEMNGCRAEVFLSVIIFSVSEFLSTPASHLPNPGRYFSNKPISGAWQNVKLSKRRVRGWVIFVPVCVCVCVCIWLATVLLEKFGVFIWNSSRNVAPAAIHRGTTQELRIRSCQHFRFCFSFWWGLFFVYACVVNLLWATGAMTRTLTSTTRYVLCNVCRN